MFWLADQVQLKPRPLLTQWHGYVKNQDVLLNVVFQEVQ